MSARRSSAGGVGAATAQLAALAGMADEIRLIDIVPGLAESIALDIEQAAGITGSPTRARGSTRLTRSAAVMSSSAPGGPAPPGWTGRRWRRPTGR